MLDYTNKNRICPYFNERSLLAFWDDFRYNGNVMNNEADQKKKRNSFILAAVLLLLSLAVTGVYFVMQQNAGPVLYVVIQSENDEILHVPLSENARYRIMDGVAEQVTDDAGLESMGEDGLESRHYVNFVTIRNGVVTCSESNCSNQVCVHTPAITGDSFDLPIVCLPHRLIIQVEERQ